MSMNPPHECGCCHDRHTGTGRIAVEIRDLSVTASGVKLIEHVCADIPEGGCTAVVGPNGAGKTTMMTALLDEIPFTGTITFRNGVRPRIGYVPQHLDFDRAMPLTVLEFLAAYHQKLPLCFGIRSGLRKKLRDLLGETGCRHLENRPLGALSGGELQRILLAGALAQKPELLILDEPASGVDFKGGEICCELLERFRRSMGFTQLMVTHDLSTVTAHATHVICLNRTVVEQGDPRVILTDDVLARTFGLHRGVPETGSIPGHECHEPCCEGKRRHDF